MTFSVSRKNESTLSAVATDGLLIRFGMGETISTNTNSNKSKTTMKYYIFKNDMFTLAFG